MFGDIDPSSAGHTTEVADASGQVRQHSADERKVAFYSQSVSRRAAIVFAGPGINFLFAILVLWGLYMFYGQPSTPPVIAAVIVDAAADKAGFEVHDEVLSIDGRPVRRFEEVRRTVTLGLDLERTFEVKRDDKIVVIKVRPDRLVEEDRFGFSNSRGFLGLVSPGNGFDVTKIREVDGVKVETPEQARELLTKNMGKDMVLTLDSAEKTDKFKVSPMAENNLNMSNEKDRDFNHLVISKSDREVFFKLNPMEGLMVAVHETGNIIVDTLKAMGQMVTGTRSAKELG